MEIDINVSSYHPYTRMIYDTSGKELTRTIAGSLLCPDLVSQRPSNRKTNVRSDGTRPATSWSRLYVEYRYPPYEVEFYRSDGTLQERWIGEGYRANVSRYAGFPSSLFDSAGLNYDSNTRNRVITEVLLKLNERKVHFGNAIAESRGTLGMVLRRSSDLAGLMLDAKRGRWNSIRRKLNMRGSHVKTSKRTADNFLEYQFGWAPLMADIYGGYELFKEGINNRPQIFSVVRNSQDPIHMDYSEREYGHNWSSSQGTRHTRCKLYARVGNETILMLSSLGLLNPAEIAWEVMPWSFVIDWFLPVGNIIAASSARAGLDFVAGYTSTWCDDVYISSRLPALGGDASRYKGEQSCHCHVRGYTRTAFSSFPFPRPYIKNPFSLRRGALASALLRQLWR